MRNYSQPRGAGSGAGSDLKHRISLPAAELKHMRCDASQTGFDFSGEGTFGSKLQPATKEQTDYDMKSSGNVPAARIGGEIRHGRIRVAGGAAED